MRRRAPILVLFDIDGTLLRGAGPHHKQALLAGIRKVTGVATTLDGVPTSGTLDRDLVRLALRARGVSARRISALLPCIVSAVEREYIRICPTDLRSKLCPGVPELLERLLEQGAAMALVTGNLRQIGWKKLECAGIRHYFSTGSFSADGPTRATLARAAVDRARRQRVVGDDVHVLMIGDHPNDVLAAKENGFGSAAVATGLVAAEELANSSPDLLLPDFCGVDPERLLAFARPAANCDWRTLAFKPSRVAVYPPAARRKTESLKLHPR